MKGTALVFALLTIGSLSAGCAEWWNGPPKEAPKVAKDDAIEAAAEPNHHLAVDNWYAKAFKVELEPDKATLKHRHPHDYVTVTIGYAELSNEVTGKEPAKVTQNHGDVRYIEGNGPSHLVHNLGATTFRNVTIEVLHDKDKAGLSKWDVDHGSVTFPGGTRDIVVANAVVRVSKIEVAAGAAIPKGQLLDHALFVALTELDLREDDAARSVKLPIGDVKWDEGASQLKLVNKGAKPAKFVLVEFETRS
jgi:quercetin dioxygenase-like cupin family protein